MSFPRPQSALHAKKRSCLIDIAILSCFHACMRHWIFCLCAVAAGVAWFYAATSPKQIPPMDSASLRRFDAALISHGEALAAIGNCDSCHTADGGARLAGGRGIPTPFGTVYSTNITPDRDTGLGLWSAGAFQRAMQEGVSRDGHYLYPAFPYDHFTKAVTQDDEALYAYLMSRPPVRTVARDNSVWNPLKFRRLIAVWNWFFVKEGPQPENPGQTREWNRGAYLVNGLGHCGACHTPRNALGAERAGRPLAGGRAEGWDAYALDDASPAPVAWTVESLATFLQMGWHAEHGVARGPMAPVTDDLGRTAKSDVHAMATYIWSNMRGRRAAERHRRTQFPVSTGSIGGDVFAASCASCHDGTEPLPFGGIDFALSSAVNASEPRNIILVTLSGLPAVDGRAVGMMPGFDAAISDEDLAALLGYLRLNFSGEPAWNNLGTRIKAARRELRKTGQP
jgi:mono/diheme cytochrome c family protein